MGLICLGKQARCGSGGEVWGRGEESFSLGFWYKRLMRFGIGRM